MNINHKESDMNLNELLARRTALQDELKAVTAQIVELAESQRRELDAVLAGVSERPTVTRRHIPRSAEARAKYSAAMKARWEAAKANGQATLRAAVQ